MLVLKNLLIVQKSIATFLLEGKKCNYFFLKKKKAQDIKIQEVSKLSLIFTVPLAFQPLFSFTMLLNHQVIL